MNIEYITSEHFKTAAKTYLDTAFWCQSLSDSEDDMVENLDDLYDTSDCHETVLAYVAGECLEICLQLRKMGKLEYMTKNTISELFRGFGGQATGAGISVTDNQIEGFTEGELQYLQAWDRARRGVHTLNMYPGDDGKVYVEGYENIKELKAAASLSKYEGMFGALWEFEGVSVSKSALLLEKLVERAESPYWRHKWLNCLQIT